ncbi:MAG: class I SAM-dependent methyltransferase [Pseudomonadota bacterium]
MNSNRFEDFFADETYVLLKNFLYNYLLRKRAIGRCRRGMGEGLVLEVGSGLSPMVTDSERIVYSELSFSALRTLKQRQGRGCFVAADAARLPFKPGAFSQVICSEVIEHLPDDRPALREMAAVLKTGGSLLITFPHRRDYFARDDSFVGHYRRYELQEVADRLKEVGLHPAEIQKVLGPLEKMTMLAVIPVVSLLKRFRSEKRAAGGGTSLRIITPLFKWLNRAYCLPVWLDARLFPRFLATVLLVRAVKV